MTLYITVQDVLDKLLGIDTSKIPNINEKLQQVFIPTAQVEVNNYLGFNVLSNTQTKYFDGNNQMYLPLKIRPIQEVTEVTIYSVPYTSEYQSITSDIAKINTVDLFGNTITTELIPSTTTKLTVDCTHGILYIPEGDLTLRLYFGTPGFIVGERNVKVTFTSGYTANGMPQQIKDAAAYMAAIMALQAIGVNSSQGALSIKIGQVTKQFGAGSGVSKRGGAYMNLMLQYDEMVQLLLSPFKNISV